MGGGGFEAAATGGKKENKRECYLSERILGCSIKTPGGAR